ncbi:MAG: DUF2950 family protein [bacterium]|nr:DUF2950 family protein [bacterium]
MTTRRWQRLFAAAAVLLPLLAGVARAADGAKLTNDQLDELVAPVALYPDSLLSQVCIAATYPLEIVEADRWAKQSKLTGDALDEALEGQDWDASVKWLCHFPDVLERMSANLDWTQALGNAFLDQQAAVMDAVQRMRAKADAAGTLKSDAKQTVVKEQQTIVIQPADPQVVYVPTYPPTVYGPTYAAAPVAYPALYPPTATWGGTLLTFGAGMATGALIAGAFDWHDHDVYVNNHYGGGGGGKNNVNVNKNVNVNNVRVNGKKWQHDPEHRRGVGYDNARDRDRYAARDRAATRDRAQRDAARGFGEAGRSRPGQVPVAPSDRRTSRDRASRRRASRGGRRCGRAGVPRRAAVRGRAGVPSGPAAIVRDPTRWASEHGGGVRRLRRRQPHARGQQPRRGQPRAAVLLRRWGRATRGRGRHAPRGWRWRRSPRRRRREEALMRTSMLTLVLVLGVAAGVRAAPPPGQPHYKTPEQAIRALADAARKGDAARVAAILGPESEDVVASGDPVADKAARVRFANAVGQRVRIDEVDATHRVAILGREDWPFPIPLVKDAGGWRFDTAAGRDEIVNRRIGNNELGAIDVARAYVEAQREYAAADRGAGTGVYAQKVRSTPGQRDGLYWDDPDGKAPSPLGPFLADADAEGYRAAEPGAAPRPYHGYLFRILTAQGASAPGGAHSYVADGKMTGGFALVAWPAEYGVSGIQTFLVNQQGIVFQKDLGAQTAELVPKITAFDPDATWTPVR